MPIRNCIHNVYDGKVWYGTVLFYGISTIVVYLMPNTVLYI